MDKLEFLAFYKQVRMEALNTQNIRSGFKATGLVPYDPDKVLSRLHILMRTPTPPITTEAVQSNWTSETPQDVRQLELQTEVVRTLLKLRTQSPPSPTERALNKLVKGCQMAMYNAVLLASENTDLRAANQKQKQKRETPRAYIANGGILTAQEGLRRAETRIVADAEDLRPSDAQPKRRASI